MADSFANNKHQIDQMCNLLNSFWGKKPNPFNGKAPTSDPRFNPNPKTAWQTLIMKLASLDVMFHCILNGALGVYFDQDTL